jgi:glycosyltransferase involved in cell wall biosynthesis
MKFKGHKRSIIYVNFSPYENTGNIFKYLLKHFGTILLFSFNFHKLGSDQAPSMLTIYKNGIIVHTNRLIQSPIAPSLAFILLPIRSVIIFFQIFYHIYRFNKKYGPFDIYFTVNAFTAWTGIVLKKLLLVKKTIFWIWDYFPPIHENKIIMFMRWMYWLFDRPASIYADRTIFLNKRLYIFRRHLGIYPKNKFGFVGIGTKLISIKNKSSFSLLFIGVLKRSQGLELLLCNTKKLVRAFPTIAIHIIGSGPDEEYFKEVARTSEIPIYFHGLLDVFSPSAQHIIKKTSIGIALYKPERGNVSYYGDPSKIKNYIGYGLPVITTNVFEFAKEIRLKKSGIIIPYTIGSFIRALRKINRKYGEYVSNSKKTAKKYNYLKYYNAIFEDVVDQNVSKNITIYRISSYKYLQ